MVVYKGKVTRAFIDRRDEKVAGDSRDRQTAERQWDFEFPEHHQCSISSGHKLYEGYEYDTVHQFFGRCDFKYVNRFKEIHIFPFIFKQINAGKIDHIVAWKYKNIKTWSLNLEEGDEVQYEILDYIPVAEVLNSIKENNEVRGFTIKM